MVSRNVKTSVPNDQSVRMYKFIALAFLLLTLILFGIVVFMSSKRADIVITTKAAPIDVTSRLTFDLDTNDGDISHVVTSTRIALQEVFTPTGSKEVPGIAAGLVTLHNESAIDQPLIATTRLLTDDGVLFRLEEGVRVPANGTLENVSVYADKEGASSDIGPSRFTIPGLNEAKQQVIYATSDAPMTGGVSAIGIVSQEDIDAAAKKLASRAQMMASEKMEAAFDNMTGVYDVRDLSVSTDVVAGEEVREVTVSASSTVIGILYNQEHLQRWAANQLAKRAIGDTEIIRPSDNAPTVTFASYEPEEKEASVNVFYDGTVTLSPQNQQIQKEMFFGKTDEEIRRYVLSLDHVNSVDIKFHPAWMQTVPHINDHVSVVVKEVE